ncbi:MAG: hypothetical protein ACI4V5_06160 [Prevotella sp.]
MRQIVLILVCLACMIANAQNQTPADSVGVWAVNNGSYSRIGKLSHQSIKGSGGLASIATLGAVKTKAKLEFKGEASEHVFTDIAHIRLYFGNPPLEQMANLYMFTSAYSIKNFDIAKFEVKKGKRYLTGIAVSIIGSSVGVSTADDIQININEVRASVYDISVSGKPGEYCLMFNANGVSGFGGVFDFSIK